MGALLAAVVLAGGACTDAAGSDLDWALGRVPWLSYLRRDISFDPWDMPRLPAEGSVPSIAPHGDAPPPFEWTQLDSVGAVLSNPFPATPEMLARGELQYQRQCLTCHGPTGAGDGPVVGEGKFPYAPPVNGRDTAARTDGYLYGVVRVGRGLMPPYGNRMSEMERWAVVHYMRRLQGGAGAVSVPVDPAASDAPINVPTVVPTAPAAERAREAEAGAQPTSQRGDTTP
jgi:mono/diheme cytochrome c family protein